ncbi:MAG: 5-formyltetrahydrofolate cyclo-ligase [Spirochaetaceae bacterium]|nr:5-formyltetrahydrofolate cyclo-ligase [Spirochaetaceae bacterium]
MTKRELRAEMKKKLSGFTSVNFTEEGEAAASALNASDLWNGFKRVLIYISMPDEINTEALFRAAFKSGKEVYSPKVESEGCMRFFRVEPPVKDGPLYNKASFRPGAFGILEPCGREADVFNMEGPPALVISPGLAFDRRGNRLGRGKGFYDRFYEKLFNASPASAICAFCMENQIVDEVPVEAFDRKVDAICVKSGLIQIAR